MHLSEAELKLNMTIMAGNECSPTQIKSPQTGGLMLVKGHSGGKG